MSLLSIFNISSCSFLLLRVEKPLFTEGSITPCARGVCFGEACFCLPPLSCMNRYHLKALEQGYNITQNVVRSKLLITSNYIYKRHLIGSDVLNFNLVTKSHYGMSKNIVSNKLFKFCTWFYTNWLLQHMQLLQLRNKFHTYFFQHENCILTSLLPFILTHVVMFCTSCQY